MVSKPAGVRTAWCVGVGTQDDPKDATWQAVFKAALQLPWLMTNHEEDTTVHKAKEGRVSVTR